MDDPTVRGYVDGFKGAYVGGWAVSAHDEPCEIVVTDEEFNVLAKGLASIERLDLASVGAGRCDFAFSIPIPTLDRIERIHITANGVELQRSPQAVGSGIFDGQVSVVRGAVEGWATERVSRAEPPQITIVDQDDNVVLRCSSSFDETTADRHFSPARFTADLPDGCFGRGEMRLTALANGVQFAQASCSLPVKGFLDSFSPERVNGWLLAPGALQRALTFEVWRNGERLCEVNCDIVRPDLQTAYPGSRRGGFDVKLAPLPPDALALTTLSFRFAGSDRDLFDGPYVLGDRAALVTTARRAAGLALGKSPAQLSAPERAVMQMALSDFIVRARASASHVLKRQSALPPRVQRPGLSIVVPIYRGVEITRACVESVLEFKAPDDRLILVNDRSPEAAMAPMLQAYTGRPDVVLLVNESNLGFVGSVNRGLSFVHFGDVLLLNSDTRLFAGGLDELTRVAHSAPDIGTVTAMSNNATIFSYPNAELRGDMLGDVSWEELAAIALARNAGQVIDVPTGHGFCMLVKREVLDRVEQLDTIFGRGYGEENDMCARAADIGYRNVAAAGVLVEHRESTSFTGEKTALLANNLAILERRYPEYGAIIEQVERRDELRGARWALDTERLQMASATGATFVLIVCNSLGGGTGQAIADLEAAVGYGNSSQLLLAQPRPGRLRADRPEPDPARRVRGRRGGAPGERALGGEHLTGAGPPGAGLPARLHHRHAALDQPAAQRVLRARFLSDLPAGDDDRRGGPLLQRGRPPCLRALRGRGRRPSHLRTDLPSGGRASQRVRRFPGRLQICDHPVGERERLLPCCVSRHQHRDGAASDSIPDGRGTTQTCQPQRDRAFRCDRAA